MAHNAPKHLLEHLEANPQIKVVYFNSAGEWLFVPNKHFLLEVTREKLLNKSKIIV